MSKLYCGQLALLVMAFVPSPMAVVADEPKPGQVILEIKGYVAPASLVSSSHANASLPVGASTSYTHNA